MNKKLPVVAVTLLNVLALSPVLDAHSTRESERLLRRQAAQEAAAADGAPTPETPPAGTEPTATPEPAPEPVAESVPVAEPAEPVLVPVPVVDVSALQAEVDRDPRSYRNDHYSFELTDKGFLRRLALADGTVLVDSAGAVNLQGSFVTAEGRRVWFYAGGVGNSTYRADVEKRVRDGAVVFDVEVTHPRFTMASTYVCGEKSVEVTVAFTPINLQDGRGEIHGIYSLQLWPAPLRGGPQNDADGGGIVYPTSAGPLRITHAVDGWRQDDELGGGLVRVGDTGIAFGFDRGSDPEKNVLRYTIALP